MRGLRLKCCTMVGKVQDDAIHDTGGRAIDDLTRLDHRDPWTAPILARVLTRLRLAVFR